MRGLRASRAAAALALAVLAACLAPCGVGASGFDAAAQGRARARDTHRHRRVSSAPRPTSLFPTSAHVSGGAVLTIEGVGFQNTAGLAVRFAASHGAPDGGPLLHETRARFISSTRIECVAPRVARGDPVLAHVSVSNGDGVWSAPPLVHVRGGSGKDGAAALTLEYDDANPGCPGCGVHGVQSTVAPERRVRERWVAVPDVGVDTGGSLVTVRAVGYAVNDPVDPFDTNKARDIRDEEASSWVPAGVFNLLGGAPSGGPGSRGRGGASRGGVSPTAATHGPKPRGTFLASGDSLRCRFECPVEFTVGGDGASANHLNGLNDASFFAVAPSRPSVNSRENRRGDDFSNGFYAAARFEEHTLATSVGVYGVNDDSVTLVSHVVKSESSARRAETIETTARLEGGGYFVKTGAARVDAASVVCVAPPFPSAAAIAAALNATNTTTTVSRTCRIAVSNDHGVTFDEGAYGNAARAAFRYANETPALRGEPSSSSSFFLNETVTLPTVSSSLSSRAATTRHGNVALRSRGVTARGPLVGGTETTLHGRDEIDGGSRFVPNAPDATCRFAFGSDAPVGPRFAFVKATISGDGKTARCVSPSRTRSGGVNMIPGIGGDEGVAGADSRLSSAHYPPVTTHAFGSACFFAAVALSNDGVGDETFSDVEAAFLYCDVHVAPLGDDVEAAAAHGTPNRPFPNLQSALSAALRGARIVERESSRLISREGNARVVLNRDVARLAPGAYGGDGNVELFADDDQILDVRAASDDDDDASSDTFFLLRDKKNRVGSSSRQKARFPSSAAVTVSCGGDRALFASTRPNAVSFSPSVFFDGCFFDGREAVTGTRCASGPRAGSNSGSSGCAGDDAYVVPELPSSRGAGGYARDPSSWEAFDYDDALEYGGVAEEAFYEFA